MDSSGGRETHEKITLPARWIGKGGYKISRHCHNSMLAKVTRDRIMRELHQVS